MARLQEETPLFKVIERDDRKIKITADPMAQSPRTQAYFGHLVLFHDHYRADPIDTNEPLNFRAQCIGLIELSCGENRCERRETPCKRTKHLVNKSHESKT